MHIPAAASQDTEYLSFGQALSDSLSRTEGYDRGKWLYVPDTYAEYRYILGTRGTHPLICIGVNPSTAAPDDLDNTLKSVARIASANDFDSWIMFNVYPQRATRPDDMDRARCEGLHRENMAAFEWVLSRSGPAPTVWAAWGAVIEKRTYLKDCVREMAALGGRYCARWVRAGKISVKGHPHHPLYLKKDEPTVPFDVLDYLQLL